MLKTLPENTRGHDYFVGDIHGCYDELMRALDEAGFDPSRDRLISVGDLVDRGPDSKKCLELTREPWFHAVLGNHEDMLVEACREGGDALYDYVLSGGEWFVRYPPAVQQALAALASALPLFLQVSIAGQTIGVVHGDFMEPRWIDDQTLCKMPTFHRFGLIQRALWGRSRITRAQAHPVEGVALVVCGHTVVPEVSFLGNVAYLDTGACFDGEITVVRGDQLLKRHAQAREQEEIDLWFQP